MFIWILSYTHLLYYDNVTLVLGLSHLSSLYIHKCYCVNDVFLSKKKKKKKDSQKNKK